MAINLNSGLTPGFSSSNLDQNAEGAVAQASPETAALRVEIARARDVLKRYTGNEPDAVKHSEQWAAQSGLNIGLTDHEATFINSLSSNQKAALSVVTAEYTAAVIANSGNSVTNVQMPDSLQTRWSDYVNANTGGQPTDINALVQWVLRESYMETSKDLYFYAEKVKFYNNVKKAIREEIGRARDVMVDYAGMDGTTALSPPFVGNPPVTDFTGGTEVANTQDNAAAQQAAAAMDAASAALQSETTGNGIHQLTDTAERDALVPTPGNGWDVFTTLDANGEPLYRIDYKGSEVKIFEKSANGEWAQTTRIWGDPHVDEGADGDSDWHFGNDSTFILPDGTKLFLDTKEVGNHVFVTSGITLLSGTDRAHAGEGGETGVFDDRQQWDADNADMLGTDGGVFALASNGEWAALGADGQFRDIKQTESFSQFKQDGKVLTEGGIVAVSEAQLAAGRDAIGGALTGYNAALDDLSEFQEVSSTKAELEAYIEKMEEKLNSVGDDAQLANVDLQNMLQKQQQTMQMMSNIAKMLHDTAMAIIRKIGG